MINKAEIKKKQQHLEFVKNELKAHFVGIDNIIESLISYIQIWYLMPEILTRPIVINLWGMTGVGKTDLIRRMVKLLDFSDRFIEIELSNIDGTSYQTSVSSILSRNKLNNDKEAIVLFDEIQRFNTKDEDGKALPQTKFTDFWELLSDGKLSKKEKDDLDYYISNYIYNKGDIKKRKLRGEENVDDNPLVGWWQSNEIYKMLNIDPPQQQGDELAEITEAQMLELLLKEKHKKTVHEPIDHSKTLIIISGNLDGAFTMAYETSETDVDADIFHAFTKKITDVDIKNALTKKFRPEQVARFGNIHLIYHSLRKADFEKLIENEIVKIIKNTKEKFGIKLKVDKSINALIYRNGVFPVQGVRPLFSSIIDILESNLSHLVFTAIMQNAKNISITYDNNAKVIQSIVGSKKINIPYIGRIDKIRQSNEADNVANISVHESGHAVVYILLTGLSPLQLISKVASSYAGGFTFPHTVYETKDSIIQKIKIYLAGGIAEELIFGEPNASIGRSQDRVEATKLAIEYVRMYGFDSEFQSNYTMDMAYAMDKTVTDVDVEKMITRLVSETRELLSKNLSFLKKLSIELAAKGKLTPKEIVKTASSFSIKALVKEEGFLKINTYHKSLHG
jgi:hypothetical protein